MNFLIDAQLPKLLSDFIGSRGHDSVHTSELPERNATTDSQIIEISTNERRVVITKDSDFLESFIVNRCPKKLVIVKTGNVCNADLMLVFKNNFEKVCSLLKENDLLEMSMTEIIVQK